MPDLVIGARRAGVAKPWRAGAIALGMLGLAVIVGWFIYRRSVTYDMPAGELAGTLTVSTTTTPPTLTYGESSLRWVGAIPVVHLVGDAHAIGGAHGRLLAPALGATIAAARPSISATVADDGWFGGSTHDMRLAWRWRFVDDGLAESDRRMAAGLARGAEDSGADVRYDDVLRDQAVLDVGAPSERSGEVDHKTLAMSMTIVAQQLQAPARVWIARTFALPGLDDGGDSATPVVAIVKPTGLQPFASVTWPGQLGVVTGVNAQGIAIFVDPVRTADVRPTRTARPVAMLARAVLEQAKTLDEAIKLVEGTPTLGAAAIVLVDGTSGTWVIVERTPGKAIVERKPKTRVLGDLLTTNALSQDPENDRAKRMLPTTARLDRAARLVRAPLPDVAAVAAVLRDQRGSDDAPRPPGHRAVIDDGRAVHQVILDPASLELWVADPQAGGRMRAFDLRHELRGEGDRPTPPADIPVDASADPDRLANLAAARAALRDARAARAAHDLGRAAEACARALARVPHLPEALELAAQIALARGDTAIASQLYQAWIDGGADDPHGEERARATLAR